MKEQRVREQLGALLGTSYMYRGAGGDGGVAPTPGSGLILLCQIGGCQAQTSCVVEAEGGQGHAKHL